MPGGQNSLITDLHVSRFQRNTTRKEERVAREVCARSWVGAIVDSAVRGGSLRCCSGIVPNEYIHQRERAQPSLPREIAQTIFFAGFGGIRHHQCGTPPMQAECN